MTNEILVPIYFVHATLGTGILAAWFLTRGSKVVKEFGWGLSGYALGLATWTALVLTKPDNLAPLVLGGAVPFLLAHFAYAKVAYKDTSAAKAGWLTTLVGLAIVATFLVRTYVTPGEPYFSEEGLLFFGLQPVSIAFYIAVISATLLPAITVAAKAIRDKTVREVMRVGLTVLYINSIILVSAQNETLLLINGWAMSLALLVAWVTALSTWDRGTKR